MLSKSGPLDSVDFFTDFGSKESNFLEVKDKFKSALRRYAKRAHLTAEQRSYLFVRDYRIFIYRVKHKKSYAYISKKVGTNSTNIRWRLVKYNHINYRATKKNLQSFVEDWSR